MRRKSTRNAAKSTPEKPEKAEPSPKTRRSRRRRRSPSKSSESEEEVVQVAKLPEAETAPDTTTKSHSPSDEGEEAVWKVTSSEDAPKGEIQKLKICLTRPSPDSPDKSKSRRSNSQTEDDATSSEDKSTNKRRTRSSLVKEDEDGKGKGKSKGKHKSKTDKEPHISEPESQTNSEISENVQVTPQSPSIDKPVDNENDYKVDDDDKIVTRGSVEEETRVSNNNQTTETLSKTETQDAESDDEPLSVIQKITSEEKVLESVSEDASQDTQNLEQTQQEVVETDTTQAEEQTNESLEPMEIQTSEPEPKSDTIETEHSSPIPTETTVTEETEHSSPIPTETTVTEETEKEIAIDQPELKTGIETEKEEVVVQEDSTETSTKQEDIPTLEEKVEENNTTEDTEEVKSENLTETVQVSAPEEASEIKVQEKVPSERTSRIKLNRDAKPHSQDTETSTGPIKPAQTKRKWEGGFQLTLVKIDLETIQAILPTPTIDFPEEPDLNIKVEKERRRSTTEPSSSKRVDRKVSVEYKSDGEKPPFEKQTSVSSAGESTEDNSNIIAFNRKISIVDDTASKLKPPPSPAKNPVSNVLYITNLVRPFTLKQLKELLERTGKIKEEEGFWTDRIKSKCYVQYETTEEAEVTRNALHGVQWPIGNGKNLIIDYATVEDLQNAKNPPAPPPVAPPVDIKAATKENLEPSEEDKSRPEEKVPKESEKKRNEGPVREWDIGKKDVRRDRSRSRERGRKHRRSPSPSDDFISRKQRKAEESVPQKLMDDLFLKTKATPSIYWQPLSPEEISMKQQQRLIRMEEHKRRMEETSRMKGRDAGRGAFRRRYD